MAMPLSTIAFANDPGGGQHALMGVEEMAHTVEHDEADHDDPGGSRKQ